MRSTYDVLHQLLLSHERRMKPCDDQAKATRDLERAILRSVEVRDTEVTLATAVHCGSEANEDLEIPGHELQAVNGLIAH